MTLPVKDSRSDSALQWQEKARHLILFIWAFGGVLAPQSPIALGEFWLRAKSPSIKPRILLGSP